MSKEPKTNNRLLSPRGAAEHYFTSAKICAICGCFFSFNFRSWKGHTMNDKTGDPQTFAIIGAAMEVHRHLGCGFTEPIYQDALEIEFRLRGMPFHRENEVTVFYKEERLPN